MGYLAWGDYIQAKRVCANYRAQGKHRSVAPSHLDLLGAVENVEQDEEHRAKAGLSESNG